MELNPLIKLSAAINSWHVYKDWYIDDNRPRKQLSIKNIWKSDQNIPVYVYSFIYLLFIDRLTDLFIHLRT